MKLRVMSDLHLEFQNMELQNNQNDDVLVLAGDVCPWARNQGEYINFIMDCSSMFKDVILVLGNHELYGGDYGSVVEDIKSTFASVEGVHILHNSHAKIGHINFIGGILWTDFRRCNPVVMMRCQAGMNDYAQIFVGGYHLTANDTYAFHSLARNSIDSYLDKYSEERCIVVTHHAPSWKSVSDEYKNNPLTPAFASDLEYDICRYKPEMWIHGHVHVPVDFTLCGTRVLANPRGYPGENSEFEPNFSIEV